MIWWLAVRPPGVHLDSGDSGGLRWRACDNHIALQGDPQTTTVRAALLTGLSPASVTQSQHRPGRPDPAFGAWIRAHSLLAQWQAATAYVTAASPQEFRARPTVERWAWPGPLPTMGDVRRGLAVAPDLTGQYWVQRGHSQLAVLSPLEILDRFDRWADRHRLVFVYTDSHLAAGTWTQLCGALATDRHAWVIVVTERVWPGSQSYVGSNRLMRSELPTVMAIGPWIGEMIDAAES